MYFPSKKDIWFFLLIWSSILVIVLLPFILTESTGTQFISSDSVAGRILSIVITAPLAWIWFRTGYTIEDGKMKIKFGPFRWTIKIEDIKKINKTRNPFSAPALSIDRLEILYGKYDVVSISPKNEHEFVELLLKENSRILVDEKVFNQQENRR